MEKYKVGATLGDGTFGVVMKGIDQRNGQVVAIKKMKQKKCPKWEDCIKLPEITSLMQFHHPNIVNLLEIIKDQNSLYFVFEYMDQNVYQLTKDRQQPFTELQIRNIVYQTLQGLAYIHRHGYFHRDLKPENLLEQNNTIKIADFGLARKIRSNPPYTDYVSTRWYRAPEVILRANNYNSPIDIFAVGCIMAELFKLWPLFPGQNELDQIHQICKVLGTPTKEEWPEGWQLARTVGYTFPQCKPQSLKEVIPNASNEAIDLIASMLRYSPQKRPSAQKALQHPFFSCNIPIPESVSMINTGIVVGTNERKDKQIEKKKESSSKIDSQNSKNNLNNCLMPPSLSSSNSLNNIIKDLLEESQLIMEQQQNPQIAPGKASKNNENMQKLRFQTGVSMRKAKFKPGVVCQLPGTQQG